MALSAMTTMPVVELTFCLVEVASFMSGDSASLMTGVPMPGAKAGLASGAVFSQMSPPDWPLALGGCGQVANMSTRPCCSSSSTIGRVWLSATVPNVVALQAPAAVAHEQQDQRVGLVARWS